MPEGSKRMAADIKMDNSTVAKGTIELATLAGPKLTMNEEVIIFRHGDKVLATITKDSSEEDIFRGLREFISVFDGNLSNMIADKLKPSPWFKASRDTDVALCKDTFRGLGKVRVVMVEGVVLIGEFEAFFERASIGPSMEAHIIGDFRKADGSGKVAVRLHGVDEIWKLDKT
jgi:hypothetical protein